MPHGHAEPAAGKKPPHVVLIMTDDMGWMDLSCQGNDKLHTPNLDALAKQGVRFTDALFRLARILSNPPRADHRPGPRASTPFSPASGPATGSFNGLHAKSKFLAATLP